ncbi:MAG: DUF72 domain-containing protein [Deltaproteobacteria bacterium]|nr:DUF72 domain-containing protein [Deltaproteobacteria bacterium]
MALSRRPRVRIGTSGYVYPHWRGRFYPEDLPGRAWLAWYAERFDTVELNNTFYRLPTEKAARGWAAQVPRSFLFAVKGSRFLTHVKRLKDTGEGIRRFFEAIAPLAGKVGPVLWQLPPTMKPDPPRLKAFLDALPGGFQPVVELRNPDWYCDAVFEVLEEAGASLCLHDLVEASAPFPPPGRLYYRRFHGAGSPYAGRYGPRTLTRFALEMERLAESGRPCFAYFNNDAQAHAVLDALDLRALLEDRLGGAQTGAPPPPDV